MTSGSIDRLANFYQNNVAVSIFLLKGSHRGTILEATFTPEHGYHLYSKDLPRDGVFGEGRPTLLETTGLSKMRSAGELTASANAEVTDMGEDSILVYPAGPVTLSLPVLLPAGKGLVNDVVSVTYMACSQTTCRPPVIGRLVTIRVPGSG